MSNPTTFRPINDSEHALISALVKKGKIKETDDRALLANLFSVSYENMQGGFCICILKITKDTLNHPTTSIYRGASRRSYKDSRNQLRGEMMAFRRAVLYSHPVNL